ncbi:hypothetical protein [Kineosporia babensis]|uniref:Uncharacterized protein n=1 Tax=Kineosporia babensis TaxID=499548 RepID=A0A9X1NA18_9ACTN|nr:hypothetical protein [Kineosporia babensis]MCD5310310.1 hypothetical protein [Kineosporia babensis]
MTVEPGAVPGSGRAPGEWHQLLMRLAGLLPDDVIADARTWLAEGTIDEMAALLAFTALGTRTPVWELDALVILDELARAGHELEPLADLVVSEGAENDDGRWAFAPVRVADAEAAAAAPLVLNLGSSAEEHEDQLDQAAVRSISTEPDVIALLRAWRAPADARARLDPDSAEPRRVYLVTVQAPGGGEYALAARIQDDLIDAGEESPQVEVWVEDSALPGYQNAAWLRSALLWAREPLTPIRVARSFDSVDPQTGPAFDAGHPRIEDPAEIERLLDYLAGAPPVLATDTTMPDVMLPDAGYEVSMTLRTDGVWVWSDTVPYYLEEYGLSPDPELLEHLADVEESYPRVSSVALHRVWCFMLGSQ